MKIQQTIQKSLDDWNRISGLDFCILDENDQIYISTGDRRLPSSEKLAQFREDPRQSTFPFTELPDLPCHNQ